MKHTAHNKPSSISEDSIESKRNVVSDIKTLPESVMKSFWDEFLTGTAKDIPQQVFGKYNKKGDHSPQVEVDISSSEEEIVLFNKDKHGNHETDTILHKEYFQREVESEELSQRHDSEATQVIEGRIQTILTELNNLKNSSQEVKVLLRQIKTDQLPVNPGRYHENFLEWMVIQIRRARERIDESISWMSLFSSKKQQKQYWNMYKKHGTTFGLSQERTAATQTG